MIQIILPLAGIEFVSRLEDLMKYINNATTAGTYVMQKYIGMRSSTHFDISEMQFRGFHAQYFINKKIFCCI